MTDYEGLRKEILDYLYTEACLMPASLIETVEVDNMSDAELIDKAMELGIIINKYERRKHLSDKLGRNRADCNGNNGRLAS